MNGWWIDGQRHAIALYLRARGIQPLDQALAQSEVEMKKQQSIVRYSSAQLLLVKITAPEGS